MKVAFLSFETLYAAVNLWAAYWLVSLFFSGQDDYAALIGAGLFLIMALLTLWALSRELLQLTRPRTAASSRPPVAGRKL
jgi:uncharacterized membrane protein YcjF (UPF0283 family)